MSTDYHMLPIKKLHPRPTLSIAVALFLCTASVQAEDTRTLGMGSASVTAGKGASGALRNPALMMEAHRSGQRYHFNFDMNGGYRDSGGLIDEFQDNEDLIDDLDAEIDRVSEQTITCTSGDPNEVCLTGTSTLAALANDVSSIFNNIDEEPFDARGGTDFGFMISHTRVPFFLSFGTRGTVVGKVDISASDKEYVEILGDVLSDDTLTLGEIQDSAPLEIDPLTNTVSVDLPDDVLDSSGSATVAVRGTLSFGFGLSIGVANKDIDFGVTPKISTVRVGDVEEAVKDLNDDDDEDGTDISDEFEASENTETTVNFDVGTTMRLSDSLLVGATIHNVIGETVKTTNDVKIETTPQLTISGLYDLDVLSLSADLALNEAKLDNFNTQALSLGIETGFSFVSVRGGIRHDLAVSNKPTDFTIGLGLGPLNISAAINGDVVRAGLQINASF